MAKYDVYKTHKSGAVGKYRVTAKNRTEARRSVGGGNLKIRVATSKKKR